MKLLKRFVLPEEPTEIKKRTREACRAIVLDENNLMPLIFVSKKNYHKLPGGWVELGEDKIVALKREIIEETWCDIDIIKEIWSVVESNSTREHTSYCYIGKVLNKWNSIWLTSEEIERWLELKRMSIDDAISTLEKDVPNDPYGYRILERDLFILLQAKANLAN